MKQEQGFTLLELLVAMVVASVLATMALNSYQGFAEKARRADAKVALAAAAAQQERFYMRNNQYSGTITQVSSASSPEGYYSLSADNTGCVGGTGACYSMTATPTVGGAQAGDTACTSFTITDTGRKTATGTLGNDCW